MAGFQNASGRFRPAPRTGYWSLLMGSGSLLNFQWSHLIIRCRVHVMLHRTKLKYRLFRASNGTSTFWRWEVYQPPHRTPLEGGVLHGTETEAKERAEVVMSRLTHQLKSAERSGPP